MKKLLCMLPVLILCFILWNDTIHANGFREVKITNDAQVLLKQEKDTASATVATLPKDTFITVFSANNQWASVQVDQMTGFIESKFLAVAPATIKFASSKSGLVVKETPSKDANTVATLTYNMVVEDFGKLDDYWSFVQYGNVTGYVATSFINTPSTSTQYVQPDEVVIRNIASPNGAIVQTLPTDTAVMVHSVLSGWAYISTEDVRGYTQASQLKPHTKATASAQNYMPQCNTTYRYVTNAGDYINMKCAPNASLYSWNGLKTIDSRGYNHYKISLADNVLAYHYEGGQEIYKFPMATGNHWTQLTPYGALVSYVLNVNEVINLNDQTYTNVIKVRVTHTASKTVKFVYLAPGIGELLIEDAQGQKNWQFVLSY